MSAQLLAAAATSLGGAGWTHWMAWAASLPGQYPVPDPGPAAPPGSDKILQILGWLKWIAAAAIIAVFLAGFIAAGVGHFSDHHRAGRTGARMITVSLGLALAYGIGYGVITTMAGTG